MSPQNEGIIAESLVSVDCAVIGFDGENLKVLLVRRSGTENGEDFNDMKLPGAIIYADENLDSAAKRVLHDLTGLDNVPMTQFRAYGSAHRTDNPKDVHWLEKAMKMKISRIVTVAYCAAVRINEAVCRTMLGTEAVWVNVQDVPQLAFDHNAILSDTLAYIRTMTVLDDSFIFGILPEKFTVLQYRTLLELLTERKIDNGNVYKKIATMPYVVPLEEKESTSAHRAARYFYFDPAKSRRRHNR